MTVSAWKNGDGFYGIRVGKPNRDKYFDPSWDCIEVEIDGKWHTFNLAPSFWKDCTEFHGTAIREWLGRNCELPWPTGRPPKFNLEVIGKQRFRLKR